jgi:hypothetical protein
MRLLHKWLPTLCELTVTVRSKYLQEDVTAFQRALLESGEMAQCFPHLHRIVLQPDNEETLDKCRSYSLDLGTTLGAGVLVLRQLSLPDSIPLFFKGIDLLNIEDPTEFNLKAITEANHIESFRIFRVMRMKTSFIDGSLFEVPNDNGMIVEHCHCCLAASSASTSSVRNHSSVVVQATLLGPQASLNLAWMGRFGFPMASARLALWEDSRSSL